MRQSDPLQIASGLYLDIGEPGVLVNHSCAPNAGIRDDVRLVALSDIVVGEEIFYDYSTTMGEENGRSPAFAEAINAAEKLVISRICRSGHGADICGSGSCRAILRDSSSGRYATERECHQPPRAYA